MLVPLPTVTAMRATAAAGSSRHPWSLAAALRSCIILLMFLFLSLGENKEGDQFRRQSLPTPSNEHVDIEITIRDEFCMQSPSTPTTEHADIEIISGDECGTRSQLV
ncbi:hypothetical protein Taro_008330 [Colocasia esculenta]|uniref:Uncharacterized protein n=1 Tax=Colocasia esculenta TaxID=4460 RepID=A0A843U227_COLES|nr:hypothetical protein [Colocasia esculenta]